MIYRIIDRTAEARAFAALSDEEKSEWMDNEMRAFVIRAEKQIKQQKEEK